FPGFGGVFPPALLTPTVPHKREGAKLPPAPTPRGGSAPVQNLTQGSLLGLVNRQAPGVLDLDPSSHVPAVHRPRRRHPLCRVRVPLGAVTGSAHRPQLRRVQVVGEVLT